MSPEEGDLAFPANSREREVVLVARVGVVALAVVASLLPLPARAMTSCTDPGSSWQSATPAQLGLDAGKLQEAIDFASSRDSWWFKVYRHGCLAGQERWGPAGDVGRWESFSMAKSVTSMLAGRAYQLGMLTLDDTVGMHLTAPPYVPDAAHGAITVRQLLTMTSGLHWNFWRDYNAFTMPDRVADALSLNIDYAPGTRYEYHQSSVSLLTKVIERAAGVDLQDFAQSELFGKIGIARSNWTWERDRAGNTAGFYGIRMRPADFARLGHLMRNAGEWNGTQLLHPAWVAGATTPTALNKGYGYLFWLNTNEPYATASVYARDERQGPQVRSAPTDMFMMDGLFEQRIYVIPSLDMVIVRLGMQGSRQADTRSSVWTSASGEFEHELFRKLMAAVVDPNPVQGIVDSGPYDAATHPVPYLDPSYGMVNGATHPEDWLFSGNGVQPPM